MEETKTQTLYSHSLRWAAITAAVSIVSTVLLYVIDYALMVQLKVLFIMLAIYLGIAIYAGIDFRKSIGGYMTFGNAFLHGYIILAVSGLAATLFSILLYTVIDPELPQNLIDASMENTRAMMVQFGAPEASMDEAMDKAKADMVDRFSVVGLLKGYITIAIASAVMALITGLVVKKNQPIE
jgi:hypothetical protein